MNRFLNPSLSFIIGRILYYFPPYFCFKALKVLTNRANLDCFPRFFLLHVFCQYEQIRWKKVQNDFETIHQQKTITDYNHSLSQKIHQLNMSAAGIDFQSSGYQITITEVLTFCTTGIDCLVSLALLSIIWLSDNYHTIVDYPHSRYRLSSVFGAQAWSRFSGLRNMAAPAIANLSLFRWIRELSQRCWLSTQQVSTD